MLLRDTKVSTIEQAFLLLPEAEQEHCRRVGAYTEAAFNRATSKALYAGELLGKYEMVPENREYAMKAGLYHDIGKLMDVDHTVSGPRIITELYPDFERLKPYHQRMLIQGAGDHHEHMDGSGKPEKKIGRAIGYMGRFVAIADELDHRSINLRSEDPIGDVLKQMRGEIDKGFYDENVFRCFTAAASAMRKTFDKYRKEMPAVPQSDAWIKKKGNRPMELGYRMAHNNLTDDVTWVAEMRFKEGREGYLPYEDVAKLLSSRKLGPRTGDYFIYEVCDALRRFKTCGVPGRDALIELPREWYTQKYLSDILIKIFEDEETDRNIVMFRIPDEYAERMPKALKNNRRFCAEAGFVFITPQEAADMLKVSDEALKDEDTIVREQLAETESEVGE